MSRSLIGNLRKREENELNRISVERRCYVTPDLIRRLDLAAELQGHNGCVNCLQWNEKGSLLASGSDDYHIMIWDPHMRKRVLDLQSGHTNNIFSVQFLPQSEDRVLLSCAGDCKIKIHDAVRQECTQTYSCHVQRVKRLAVTPAEPNLFWSAGEDGTVMQFDVREAHHCDSDCAHVLINLNSHVGVYAETKCIAINPCRPEYLAVGANDPYARLYDRRMISLKKVRFPSASGGDRAPWDRHVYTAMTVEGEDYQLPSGAVDYFVAGHLPVKYKDFRKRYRPLAITYLTFSPDGTELLANLGGEQIYLFNINSRRRSLLYDIRKMLENLLIPGMDEENSSTPQTSTSNGHSMTTVTSNGVVNANGLSKFLSNFDPKDELQKQASKRPILSRRVELLKQRGNQCFEREQWTPAIDLYNKAIAMQSKVPVLMANRAASFMKRDWDGDVYAALRDCVATLHVDPGHTKAHFRLARCLLELKQYEEARKILALFKLRFPSNAQSNACCLLEKDINSVFFTKSCNASKKEKSEKRKRGKSPETDDAMEIDDESDEKGGDDSEHEFHDHPIQPACKTQEVEFRNRAYDFEQRFCGHCNTTTDIKEANFFGRNGEYIIAGSDDGSFFIWDKETCNNVRVLKGDDSIVNCLQPHPTTCLLATSGIDPVIRLWEPKREDSETSREITDVDKCTRANQRRMNADPLEVMLLNMGYRLSSNSSEAGAGSDNEQPVIQCQQS